MARRKKKSAAQIERDRKFIEGSKKTQFKKGNTAAVGRRPAIKYLSEYLREFSQLACNDPKHIHAAGDDNNACAAWGLIKAARGSFSEDGSPNLTAWELFADRTEGAVEKKMSVRVVPDLGDETIDDVANRVLKRNADEPKA